MKKVFLSSLITSSLLLGSSSFEININNETLEVSSEVYLNDTYNVNNSSNYYFIASYLNTEDEESDKTSSSLVTAGFKVLNPYSNDNGLSLGLGVKSVYSNNEEEQFFAVPLSLYSKLELNELIYFDLGIAYAPKVLSFSDAQKYTDIKFKTNYKVLEDGYLFLGYRNIETEYENYIIKYDTSLFVGFQIKF